MANKIVLKMSLETLAEIESSGVQVRVSPEEIKKAKEYKERIVNYSNPVEFVNNMYGCHPDESGVPYFNAIFSY